MVGSSTTVKSDVLVIGAGLLGSAVALGLARAGCTSVAVVDLDLMGEWSSSELNAGGVRATWSQKVNLLTSKYSIEHYATIADQVGYRDCGYLWLHKPETFQAALKTREMHVANGWPVEVLDVAAIRARYPFMDKTDDLAGALLGVRDGLVNPNRLKEYYREEAAHLGKGALKFYDGIWVYESDGKKVKTAQFSRQLTTEEKKDLLTTNPRDLASEQAIEVVFEAEKIVNCAGAWAPQVAKILGYDCPSKPVRRQISLFHARDLDLTPYGMMIDTSGVYFHPESIYGLSGFAVQSQPAGIDFTYDGESFFEEYIWPNLAERSTAFESLRHVSGWAGLYENSPDHHAIVGGAIVGSASSQRIFEAHSFSGHGAMQSYGVGVALAEKIVNEKYETLDLTELSADRFLKGKKIESESWVI